MQTQLRKTDGNLYRASRIVNSSESMRDQTVGRHTGAMGTGVYFFRTRAGAEAYAKLVCHGSSPATQIYTFPEPLRPFIVRDFQCRSFHEFSMSLNRLAWLAKHVSETQDAAEAELGRDRLSAGIRLARFDTPASLACSIEEISCAILETASNMRGRGFDDLHGVSQPINRLLRAKGYDGVLVEPEGAFDSGTYGSVYFVEDFASRFPGVLPRA